MPNPAGAIQLDLVPAPQSAALNVQSGSTPSATQLLDWAEWQFASLFPSHEADQYVAPYTFRFYPATGNYLGVSGGSVYLLGPASGGSLAMVGAVQSYACAVLPESCGTYVSGISATVNAPASYLFVTSPGAFSTQFPVLSITANFSGDMSVLAGRQLYVIVEDPGGLFHQNSAQIHQDTATSWALLLTTSSGPGVFSGHIRVQLCLDLACSLKVQGATATVPYYVNVLDPLVLSIGQRDPWTGDMHNYLNLTSLVNVPATATVTFTIPRYTSSWSAQWFGGYVPGLTIGTPPSADSGTGVIALSMQSAQAGSWHGAVRVTANLQPPNSAPVTLTQDIQIGFVVAAAEFSCEPTPLNLTAPYLSRGGYRLAVPNCTVAPGAVQFGGGFEYLTWPAGTDDFARSWYYYDHVDTTYLGVGVYTGRFWEDVQMNGVITRFYWPTTLTITPAQ